jgi:hypothetical protein
MAGPALAWIAIGAAGREAAKKYGALIARKMFPKLFKKADPKKKPPKRDHYKEEMEGNKKFEESQRKEKLAIREKKRAFTDNAIKKEQARIKSKAPPQNEIEAARDKEYAARKAYDKMKETQSKHNRN